MHDFGVSIVWLAVQVTIVAAVCAVLYRLVKSRGPALRSLVAWSSLMVTLLLAGLAFSPWPSWSRDSALAEVEDSDDSTTEAASVAESTTEVVPVRANPAVADSEESVWKAAWGGFIGGLRKPEVAADGSAPTTWPMIVAYLFMAGLAFAVLRLLAGSLLLRFEVRRSAELHGTPAREMLDFLIAEQQLRTAVSMRETSRLTTAAVVGWRRPTILLPTAWRSWSGDQLRAVLTHELAHVRRGDFLSNLCAELGRAVHFYHPLVHWLAARLRLEQELAADADAAHFCGGSKPYLKILAEMAMAQSARRVQWPARAFLPTRTTFLRRIDMLRDKTAQTLTGTPSRAARFAVVFGVLAAGIAASGLRGDRDAIAQDDGIGSKGNQIARGGQENTAFRSDFVPINAIGVLAIRPADLLSKESMRPILRMMENEEKKDRPMMIFGSRPQDIDKITMVFLAADRESTRRGMSFVVVMESNKAIDKKAVEEQVGGGLVDTKHGSTTYRKKDVQRGADAVWLVDEKTAIIADNNRAMTQVIDTLDRSITPRWRSEWKAVANSTVAGIADMRVVRAIVAAEEHARQQRGQRDLFLGNPMFAIVSPIWDNTDVASLGLDVDKSVKISATLHQDRKGKDVKATLDALLTLGKNMLGQWKRGDKGDNVEQQLVVQSLITSAENLLESVKVEQTDEDVTVSTALPDAEGFRMVGILLPAMQQAREAARRTQAKNNLKQIGLAMHNYHATYGKFPPAVLTGPDGKTKHSWRVALLPFLDQKALYDQYRLNEPWDSEHNTNIMKTVVPVYRNPNDDGDATNSSYFAVVGERTAFGSEGGTKIREIVDGTSNTVMVVESKQDIPWTKPEDIKYDGKKAPKLGGFHQGGFQAVFCDGAAHFISENIDEKVLRHLLERNDGNPVNLP